MASANHVMQRVSNEKQWRNNVINGGEMANGWRNGVMASSMAS